MNTYYNEIDPFAAEWLRELIKAGHIAQGEVDERDIRDIVPSDLYGFRQCHFFAGIGGWSYALRLAGWPDDRPVWTGSCPCQPFSQAGQGKGAADERHLWPAFHHLIKECRPHTVFGEQVGSKAGRQWLDLVHDDLEGENYAVGATVIPACGVGAPHIRQRIWFVAERVENTQCKGLEGAARASIQRDCVGPAASGGYGGLADTLPTGRTQGWAKSGNRQAAGGGESGRPSPTNGFWRDANWIHCRDGKWRPVEPGTFPLAHGVSNRVGRLRGYGNAIVPEVAKTFIEAYMA